MHMVCMVEHTSHSRYSPYSQEYTLAIVNAYPTQINMVLSLFLVRLSAESG